MATSAYGVRKKKAKKSAATGQGVPLDERQVMNNAGGFVYEVDKWAKYRRFLILGTEGGTFYVGEKKLTDQNIDNMIACLKEDPYRFVNEAVVVSVENRAYKNDTSLFAMAVAMTYGDDEAKQYVAGALTSVARIGTHLFHFVAMCEHMGRGWGTSMRRAIGNWYDNKTSNALAMQIAKYKQRDGWSHRDVLRMAHPKPANGWKSELYGYAVGKVVNPENAFLKAVEAAKVAKTEDEIVRLIADNGLPRECIPTHFLNSPAVWDALLQNMGMTAMIRNLGKMSSIDLIKHGSKASRLVEDRLLDADLLREGRIHPMALLIASAVYSTGRGMKGDLRWDVDRNVVSALDKAFYLSFGNVAPSGKRLQISLDVSGSMDNPIMGTPLSCAQAAAAMALVTANAEKDWMITAFSSSFKGAHFTGECHPWAQGDPRYKNAISEFPISPRDRLETVVQQTKGITFGATDCALPMVYAMKRDLEFDAFVIITDNETWHGHVHPMAALRDYREKTGIAAKLIVVAMASTGFTIGDPSDRGCLDVVGFDTATPNVISDFVRGDII